MFSCWIALKSILDGVHAQGNIYNIIHLITNNTVSLILGQVGCLEILPEDLAGG